MNPHVPHSRQIYTHEHPSLEKVFPWFQQNPIPKITAVEFAVFLELLKAFELNL